MKDALIGDAYAWVGEIPDQWEFRRLGSCFTERRATTTGELAPPLSVTKSGVIEQQEHVAKSVAGAPKKVVHSGDLVINSRSDRKGSAGLAPRFGSVSLINIVLQPTGIHPQFGFFLLRSTAFQEEFFRHGSGIVDDLWTTRYADAKTIKLPIPPLSVQKNIAEFLDRETAEIDSFIADQERLIELLEERRAATITHAVTKGLDPNAPMTDSGIDWLGTVPYHWSIRKLKTLANLTTAKTDNQLFSLGLEHVQSWTGELNVESLDGEVATQGIGFQKNDVLFGKLRPNLAKVWVATRSGTAIGDFLVIRPGSELAPKFLGYLMRTPSFISVVVGSMYGAKMPRTSWDFVKNIAWSIPSIKEQKTIVEFLNLETAKIDAAVSDAREAIALSRERRAALISAAVTGQLDVSQAQRPVDEVLEQGVQV